MTDLSDITNAIKEVAKQVGNLERKQGDYFDRKRQEELMEKNAEAAVKSADAAEKSAVAAKASNDLSKKLLRIQLLIVFLSLSSLYISVSTSAEQKVFNENLVDSVKALASKQRDMLIEVEIPFYVDSNRAFGWIALYNSGTLPIILDDLDPRVYIICPDWNQIGGITQVGGDRNSLVFRPDEDPKRFAFDIKYQTGQRAITTECYLLLEVKNRHPDFGNRTRQFPIHVVK